MFDTPDTRERAAPRVVAISVVLHVLVGAAIIRILLVPLPMSRFFHHETPPSPHTEAITYVAAPPSGGAAPPARAGGNGKPIIGLVPPPLVAPLTTPTSVPPVPPPVPRPPVPLIGDGTGPIVRTGGPTQGVSPQFHDPKVWAPPGVANGGPPKTQAQMMDSLSRMLVQGHNDSLGPPRKQPGDWTTNINGQKWGVDQKFIHLGPVSIPTAVLAILPLNVTANPIDNDQVINARHAEIGEQANRAMNEEAMNKAIKDERLRKEKEHEAAKKQTQPPPPPKTDQSGGTPIAAKDGSN
jgi:hypothetical protein